MLSIIWLDGMSRPAIGAAWIRMLTGGNPGYGYVDDQTPELSIAVKPAWRGRGIGTALLVHLLRETQPRYRALSLSVASPLPGKRLRPSGGYRKLDSFQAATIIFDVMVRFCDRFVDRRSRTVDQMVQAARSGRQNIGEGNRAAATSSQMELKLVKVARANSNRSMSLRRRRERSAATCFSSCPCLRWFYR